VSITRKEETPMDFEEDEIQLMLQNYEEQIKQVSQRAGDILYELLQLVRLGKKLKSKLGKDKEYETFVINGVPDDGMQQDPGDECRDGCVSP